MSNKSQLQRILIKGGVLSPSELKQIIAMAETLGLQTLSFGSRQDILLPFVEGQAATLAQFPTIDLETIANKKHQNISCSYVASEIRPTTNWLGSATYLYLSLIHI